MSVALALLLALQAGGAGDSVTRLLAAARAGTERFRDPSAALAEGFRPVGPDFPGMGQHWIHPGLLLEGALDPARPHVLEYADIRGTLTLVGVAYVSLATGGRVPDAFPVSPEAWHFHGGTVSEESFVRGHALGEPADSAGAPRLAVLHAWIWLDNPAGVFRTDNWSLPFARVGLEAPPGVTRGAAEAMALAAPGGEAYMAALLKAVGRPDSVEAAALGGLVAEAAA
ncbi:MAG: hypothetical protein ACRDHF_02515, partial [Tepidiformaceae bacterium]